MCSVSTHRACPYRKQGPRSPKGCTSLHVSGLHPIPAVHAVKEFLQEVESLAALLLVCMKVKKARPTLRRRFSLLNYALFGPFRFLRCNSGRLSHKALSCLVGRMKSEMNFSSSCPGTELSTLSWCQRSSLQEIESRWNVKYLSSELCGSRWFG